MNEFITLLGDIPSGTVLSWIVAFSGLISLLIAGSIKGYKLFEKARTVKNASESKENLINQNKTEIADIKQNINSLYLTVNEISNQVNNLSHMLLAMQEKNDSKERANLKDRIGQVYLKFHKEQEWNSMEKESLEDLIESYEQCGGTNSFIHSVVQKEMYLWRVIE